MGTMTVRAQASVRGRLITDSSAITFSSGPPHSYAFRKHYDCAHRARRFARACRARLQGGISAL